MTEQEWREGFARFIRVGLNNKKMTRQELSALSGVSEKSISRYLKCCRTANGYAIQRITEVLKN